jgi:hypothetical protein
MKQDHTTSPKPAGTKPHQTGRKTGRKIGLVIAAALLFLGLAASVFLISDQFAQKNTIGIPQFQDNNIELIDQNGIVRNQDDFADRYEGAADFIHHGRP